MRLFKRLYFVIFLLVLGGVQGQIPGEQQGDEGAPNQDEIQPQLDRIETTATRLRSELEGIRTSLEQVAKEVERPSLVRRIGEDFVSNALWALLTSSENDGNRIRWFSSLLGLFLVLAKILLFFLGRRKRGRAIEFGGTFLNFGLWVYAGTVVVFLLPLAVFQGIQVDASDANLASIERNLAQVSEQLNGLTADVERTVVETLGDQLAAVELETRGQFPPTGISGLGTQIDTLDNALAQTRSDMATDGIQILSVLMLSIVMLLSIGIMVLVVGSNS